MTVTFIIDDGLLRWGEMAVELTRRDASLLGVLRKLCPHYVATERLAAAHWPYGLPEEPAAALSMAVSRLRRKLAGMPVVIETRSGYGYRLVGDIEVM